MDCQERPTENHWLSFNLYTLSVHIPTCDITFTTECCTAIVHLTIVDQDATNIPFYLTVPCSYSNAFDALCKHLNVSYIISGSVRNTQKQKQTSFVQHKPSATERRVKSCMHKVVSMISLSSNSNSKALSDVGSLSFIVLLPSDAISSTIEVKS